MTEGEVIGIIQLVAHKLSQKYKYSYHTREDMEQDAFIEAFRALETYDCTLPLENYLTICLRNHFLNMRRKHVERAETPCNRCALNILGKCWAFVSRSQCGRYDRWKRRNDSKRLLANGVSTGSTNSNKDGSAGSNYDRGENDKSLRSVEYREILERIEERIPLKIRKQYLKWKNGIKIGAAEEREILEMIGELVEDINVG